MTTLITLTDQNVKRVGPRKAKQREPGNKLEVVGLDLGYTNPGNVGSKIHATVSTGSRKSWAIGSWTHSGSLMRSVRAGFQWSLSSRNAHSQTEPEIRVQETSIQVALDLG